jgi:DNA-binding NtrC family response regulator
VDDEESIAQFGQDMLKSLGYEVLSKTNSLLALEIFKKDPQKFDLVITDQTMPNMTGDVLAKEIMKIRSEIPVILCTGFSHTITAEEAKAIGIRGFLMKPFVTSQIANTTRNVLDQDKNKQVKLLLCPQPTNISN